MPPILKDISSRKKRQSIGAAKNQQNKSGV